MGQFYTTRYRGPYLYLVRTMYVTPTPVCRLKYTGQMDDWDFAIYKYSTERYDPAWLNTTFCYIPDRLVSQT